MPDNPELIELLECELNVLVAKANKSGLTYSQILRIFLEDCLELQIMLVDADNLREPNSER